MNLMTRVSSAVVAVGLSLAGLSGTWTIAAVRTDVLVVAKDISDIRTPDPSKSYDVGGVFLQFPIYSRLVRQRAPNFWKIEGDLAESWSVSADATTYTFTLRKDAAFPSGNPVTSEDVRFSLLRAKNIKGYGSFLADPLKSVEIVDPRIVRVILSGPDATFLAALAAGVFSIVDSKTVRAQGGVETVGADSLDKAEQWFYSHSAGAAPYVLQRYTRETEIVLERNEKYYGSKPFFREVIVKHIKDPSTQSLTLQRADVDMALDLSVDQAESLKGKSGVTLFEDPSAYTVYLGLNTSVAPWDNVKVREAVKYAIDYDGIVSGIMRGHGRRIGSIMMPGMLGFPESLNTQLLYKHDPSKAAALLKEAGVSRVALPLSWASGTNYGHWQSPEAAKLVSQAQKTADVPSREKMYEQYNKMLAAPDSPYVFLAQPTNLVGARADITGFKFHPLYFLEVDSLRRK